MPTAWTPLDRAEALAYLTLGVLGAVWPWSYNLAYMEVHEQFDVAAFVAEAVSTPAGGSLTVDLGIGGTAWLIWMVRDARQHGLRWWPWVGVMFLVAFACACPLFLLRRKLWLMSR